ncbi:type II toxin-antitoxin system CcdA family antitoxin [Neptunicella sp. SCSIO 80796]|uniref:type II toxin-antitoxin system CcdA family antitoxin n=1 Tax=Neptunicella plasticusilytica TaxID=3117012 RepID=UPI003A4DC748
MKSRFGSTASKKVADINLSATLEQSVRFKRANASAEHWAKDNKNAIKSYNGFIEENGIFGDEFKTF